MADYISTEDLASYLQTTLAADSATLYVTLTNGLITDLIGDLSPVPTTVKAIALEVAARGYSNATGITSVTKSFDDASKTERREVRGGKRGVFLTAEDIDALLAAAGLKAHRGVGSIQLKVPLRD